MAWGDYIHWGCWLVGVFAAYGMSLLSDSMQGKNRSARVIIFIIQIALGLCLMTFFPLQWGKANDTGCTTEYDKTGNYSSCN